MEQEQLTEAKPIYKVVKIRDSKYVSGVAGAPGFEQYPELEYKIGEVTKAPEDSDGIFCMKRYDSARTNADTGDTYLRQGLPTAVLEVYPCGEAIGYFNYYNHCRYPAVYVAKELWRQQPPEPPKPVEVDVTAECTAELWSGSDGWTHIDVIHKGATIMCLQNSFTLTPCDSRYRIEVDTSWPSTFKVYKKA